METSSSDRSMWKSGEMLEYTESELMARELAQENVRSETLKSGWF